MKPQFEPGTSAEEAHDISTPAGRRLRFNERIDALTKPKSEGGKAMSLDDAIFEMRGNQEDRQLLFAMGYSGHNQEHARLLDRMTAISRATSDSPLGVNPAIYDKEIQKSLAK